MAARPRGDDAEDEAIVQETLDALQMPPRGLRRWFHDDRRFCNAHGGRRVYGELLALIDRYEAALDRRQGRGERGGGR